MGMPTHTWTGLRSILHGIVIDPGQLTCIKRPHDTVTKEVLQHTAAPPLSTAHCAVRHIHTKAMPLLQQRARYGCHLHSAYELTLTAMSV